MCGLHFGRFFENDIFNLTRVEGSKHVYILNKRYYTSFKHGFGINWEFLDFLGPCSIFFDAIDFLGEPVSVMTDEIEIIYEGERYKEKEFNQLYVLGITLDLQLIKLHFPLLVNWDTDLELGGQAWQDQIRAEFNMDFSSFSFR